MPKYYLRMRRGKIEPLKDFLTLKTAIWANIHKYISYLGWTSARICGCSSCKNRSLDQHCYREPVCESNPWLLFDLHNRTGVRPGCFGTTSRWLVVTRRKSEFLTIWRQAEKNALCQALSHVAQTVALDDATCQARYEKGETRPMELIILDLWPIIFH